MRPPKRFVPEVSDHLLPFGRGVGDPQEALGAFDVRNRNHFPSPDFEDPRSSQKMAQPKRLSNGLRRQWKRKGAENRVAATQVLGRHGERPQGRCKWRTAIWS